VAEKTDASAKPQRPLSRRIWPWALFVGLLVIVLPAITFLVNRTFEGVPTSAESDPVPGPVFSGGIPYVTEDLFSLAPGEGPNDIAVNESGDARTIVTFEVAAPDGRGGYWIVDHPLEGVSGARVRRFSPNGEVDADFVTPAGTTLFTPGIDGDLWVDQSAGAGSSELLLHYASDGELLGTFPLPERLFARSFSVSSEGRVYALAEEWLIDPSTEEAFYSGTLVPIVDEDGAVVADPAAEAVNGSFIGTDGRIYSVEGTKSINAEELPPLTVTAAGDGGAISTYNLPSGLRPYAADADGRVYTEPVFLNIPDAPGVSTLGDAAGEWSVIRVFAEEGEVSQLPVQRAEAVNSWAPAAWPSVDGSLLSTLWSEGRFHLVKSVMVEDIEPLTAAADPTDPDVRIISTANPLSGDPYLAEDVAQRDLMTLIYSGLVTHNASLTPQPDLAETIPVPGDGVSEDGRTIEWVLSDGRTWHDGEPVTAEDVVATYEHLQGARAISMGEPFPGFDRIESVEADGKIVRVRLTEPFGAAPTAFFPYVLPAHIVSESVATNGGLYAAPVGSGPYALTRWEADHSWQLKAHSGAEDDTASISTLEILFADGEDALNSFQRTSVPTVWSWVPAGDAVTLERDAVGAIVSAETGRWWGSLLDTESEVLGDVGTRSALVDSYPFDRLFDEVLVYPRPIEGVDAYPSVSPAHDPETPHPGERPDEATTLLAEAGWSDDDGDGVLERDGVPFAVEYALTTRDGVDELVSQQVDMVVETWESLGSDAEYKFSKPRYYTGLTRSGFLASSLYSTGAGVYPSSIDPGWGGVFDPQDTPSLTNPRGIGVTHVDDDVLEDAYARARIEYDSVARARIGREITARAIELGLVIFERYEVRDSAVLGIEGYEPGPYPAGEFWNIEQWSIAEEVQQ